MVISVKTSSQYVYNVQWYKLAVVSFYNNGSKLKTAFC